MDRRHFLSMLGLGAVGLALPGVAQADILKQSEYKAYFRLLV